MIKQGADMIPAATLRALALETSLKHSLVADNGDHAPEPSVAKMRCFELS
jgi:hypothetical protein